MRTRAVEIDETHLSDLDRDCPIDIVQHLAVRRDLLRGGR
jgi:hypothetical protein